MFKKIIPLALVAVLLTVSSGVNIYAAANGSDEPNVASKQSDDAGKGSLKRAIEEQTKKNVVTGRDKSTLADYEREKQKGKGFSTSTKVLIGVGIAAAAVGIFVFAASRDKVRTF